MEASPFRLLDASQLRKGLFVQLDIGWMEHPFPVGSFKITSDEQLQALRALGLPQVRVDPARSDVEAWRAVVGVPGGAFDAGSADAQAPGGGPGVLAHGRRVALLEAQRRGLALCEKHFLDLARGYRRMGEQVQDDPCAARTEGERVVGACVDELAAHGESVIRLLSEGVGERSAHHPVNVTVVSLLLARALGVADADLPAIGLAAFIHDIGKLALPERVRHLEAHFAPADVRAYQEHVAHSVLQGQRMQLPADVLLSVAQHHEMADGDGFPLRLTGERMTLGGRILSLVNRYDNLCNPARNSVELTPHEALSLLFAQMQPQFDANVLGAFIRMMGVYPPGSVVQLVDDRFALVVSVNSSRPLRPRVVVHDSRVPKEEALVFDLESAPELGIRRSLKPSQLPRAAMQYLSPRRRISYFFERSVDPLLGGDGA